MLIGQRLLLRLAKLCADKGDLTVPTGDHHMPGGHGLQTPALQIGRLDSLCRGRVTEMAQLDAGRPKPNAHAARRLIEAAIVGLVEDEIFHRFPRHSGWNQRAYDGARKGGVAVGKVVDVFVG